MCGHEGLGDFVSRVVETVIRRPSGGKGVGDRLDRCATSGIVGLGLKAADQG